MLLIESILIVLLIGGLLKNQIKKYPGVFYLLTILLNCAYIFIGSSPAVKELSPVIQKFILGPLNRGALGTGFIVVVMYLGILKKKGLVRDLMEIRGELSIIGSILIFGHNILFGKHFFLTFFADPSKLNRVQYIATIISLIMLVLLIPLFITSFKCVRRKMNPSSWKKLQKLAYTFFILIYVHVMILFAAHIKDTMIEVIIYTAIWGFYIIKLIQKKSKKTLRV